MKSFRWARKALRWRFILIFVGFFTVFFYRYRKFSPEAISSDAETFQRRMTRIKERCRAASTGRRLPASNKTSERQLVAVPGSHVCFCYVPKAGSTFWGRALMMLTEPDRLKEFKYVTGIEIHNPKWKTNTRNCITSPSTDDVMFSVTRDPYDRLFSAYLDKVYLPKFWRLSLGLSVYKRIKDSGSQIASFEDAIASEIKTGKCDHDDVTFQDFLDYILLEYNALGTTNAHFTPVSSLCNPCDRQSSHIIIRYENFLNESKVALKLLRFGEAMQAELVSLMEEESVYVHVYNLLSTLKLMVTLQNTSHGCVQSSSLTQRLWNMLKAKGFIKDTLQMPEVFRDIDVVSMDIASVTDSLKGYFLDRVTGEVQRRRYLASAYRAIRPRTVRKIEEMFELDFLLFDYRRVPPGKRQEDKQKI